MHGQFEGPLKRDRRTSQPTAIQFLVLPIFLAVVLVALMVLQPNAATWIAEAAQAEFVGDAPSVLPPTQLAQPAAEPHSVASDWIARVQTAWRGQR
jgi:hypothetical protein